MKHKKNLRKKCLSSKCFSGNLKWIFENPARDFLEKSWKNFAEYPKMIESYGILRLFFFKMYNWRSRKQFWQSRSNNFDRCPKFFCSLSVFSKTHFFLKNITLSKTDFFSETPSAHVECSFEDRVEKFQTKISKIFSLLSKRVQRKLFSKTCFGSKSSFGHVGGSFGNHAKKKRCQKPIFFSIWRINYKHKFLFRKNFFEVSLWTLEKRFWQSRWRFFQRKAEKVFLNIWNWRKVYKKPKFFSP